MYSSDLTAFGKKCCCCFFFPFWCLVFDMFWCCTVLDLVISTYFNHVNGSKCLIHINLCTESDLFPFLFSCIQKKNSTRLQWYSCARYKAPGSLVSSQVYKSWGQGVLVPLVQPRSSFSRQTVHRYMYKCFPSFCQHSLQFATFWERLTWIFKVIMISNRWYLYLVICIT